MIKMNNTYSNDFLLAVFLDSQTLENPEVLNLILAIYHVHRFINVMYKNVNTRHFFNICYISYRYST